MNPAARQRTWLSLLVLAAASHCLAVQQSWVARYSLLAAKTNQAIAIALSPDGKVVVAGSSMNASNDLDYLAIKYAADGSQAWLTRFDSTNDELRGMALDGNGNVLLTGTSKTLKLNSNGSVQWTNSLGGRAVCADSNNVYITGYLDLDFATARLNTGNGSNVWTATYDKIGRRDISQVIASDSSSNVYVAGFEVYMGVVGSAIEGYRQMTVIKYSPSGGGIWTNHPMLAHQDGLADANGIYADNSGNAFALGNHSNNYPCYVASKSDLGGNEFWRWNMDSDSNLGYSGNGRALKVDQIGNVYMTGSIASGSGGRYCTVMLTNGHRAWFSLYRTIDGVNNATAIALDSGGNVYVTGYCPSTNSSGSDIVTIKYDNNGNQLWVQTYDGPAHGDDIATGIVVDATNNVYVTGYSATTNGGTEFVTIKYSQLPQLAVSRAAGKVVVSWPTNAGSFTLQSSTNFFPPSWSAVAQSPSIVGDQFCVTNSPSGKTLFYRLRGN